MDGVVVFESVNEVFHKYGSVFVPSDRLKSLGIDHILIKGNDFVIFTLVCRKDELYSILEKDFRNHIHERIPGFRGLYGYNGMNIEIYNDIRSFDPKEKLFLVTLTYEGPYYIVNSGIYSGWIIITQGYQNINLKKIE